ncbi:hypothetical protein HU200_055454 [Digitaria exilis]|uniref:Uncharacterized protein n=1 Tax=Digitaria exilis TaxID=1010633 RepID=A0A835AMB9_9POAL|nr:hypothetical protein HU200_055454 [Digitaria exilis]
MADAIELAGYLPGEPGPASYPQSMDDRMAEAIEESKKIRRFPYSLRGMMGEDNQYALPSVVSIGPWWRLRIMDTVKLAAAYSLCKLSARSPSHVYDKVISILGHVRGHYEGQGFHFSNYYHSPFDVSDGELATMMFLDGCFLLQYMMGGGTDPMLQKLMSPSGIKKDIFMIENQIPYLVLKALMEFVSFDVHGFIATMGTEVFPNNHNKEEVQRQKPRRRTQSGCTNNVIEDGSYEPPHLLGLLHFHLTGSMPEMAVPCGAAELARIGIKLAAATTTATCRLSLSPLFLDDVTVSWLVNMAAVEETAAGDFIMPASSPEAQFRLSSYLSVMAMLVNREEDVQELRGRQLLHGTLSNTQALAFFKGLGHSLHHGRQYDAILEKIDTYKRDRKVRVAVYRFLYDNYKTIAAVLSITGVLIGIFKTLLSFKQH